MSFDDADLFTCSPDDELTATDPVEAIDEVDFDADEDQITVYGFKRATVDPKDIEAWALLAGDDLAERFDEEYGYRTKLTDDQRATMRKAVGEIVAGFVVWNCTPCGQRDFVRVGEEWEEVKA